MMDSKEIILRMLDVILAEALIERASQIRFIDISDVKLSVEFLIDDEWEICEEIPIYLADSILEGIVSVDNTIRNTTLPFGDQKETAVKIIVSQRDNVTTVKLEPCQPQ